VTASGSSRGSPHTIDQEQVMAVDAFLGFFDTASTVILGAAPP